MNTPSLWPLRPLCFTSFCFQDAALSWFYIFYLSFTVSFFKFSLLSPKIHSSPRYTLQESDLLNMAQIQLADMFSLAYSVLHKPN